MKLHRSLAVNLKAAPSSSVVTLGNFDGVHIGHQALLKSLKQLALPEKLTTHVVTFTPHPRDYFAQLGRGVPVLGINSVRQRLEHLRSLDIDHVHVLRFNHALATLSPQEFVAKVLVAACGARHVLVGRDVRFGHQRLGDWALLKTLGEQHGFTVHCFDEVLDEAALRISSSNIRHDLHAGHIVDANESLGYAYSLSGRVLHGRKLGRTLQCPTLNLNPKLPNPALRGVLVVAIDGLRHPQGHALPRLYGVANLGLRPTVESTSRFSLEVHVFNWTGDAYGQRVTVTFLHKLRSEATYADLASLQAAIAHDMTHAKAWLASYV
jgi:riboflavin kinase / FMN adenylyltransferase